ALANQPPVWPLGSGHGYHPRTFGFLLDELVRRMSGLTISEYWRKNFGEPLALDLWKGVPPDLVDSIAPIQSPRVGPKLPDNDFFRAYVDAETLTFKTFAPPAELKSVAAMNTPEARTASFPAFGGIGTAAALAKFYAMLANGGELDGHCF